VTARTVTDAHGNDWDRDDEHGTWKRCTASRDLVVTFHPKARMLPCELDIQAPAAGGATVYGDLFATFEAAAGMAHRLLTRAPR
jgi:hypothetical protein